MKNFEFERALSGSDRMSGKGNAATLPGTKAKHTVHNIISNI